MARVICGDCQRPKKVCVCDHIRIQEACFPVIVLQHPDEAAKPLSTVPILRKSLSRIHVYCAEVFDQVQCFKRLAEWGAYRPLLVYPKIGSQDVQHICLDCSEGSDDAEKRVHPQDALILLDGTWRNTREIMLANAWLSQLPTLALINTPRSRYRIRKATRKDALSTIETVACLMGMLDPHFSVETLLHPFDKMIDHQIANMGQAVFERNYC